MAKEGGIPKSIIKELDIHEEEKDVPMKVTPIVEPHQIKLPIPSKIRLELDIKKGKKIKVTYDKKKKKIIYHL